MNVLVTGGAGYIGSQTCKLLKQSGFSPVVYDNLSRGRKELVRWGPLVEGDILDTKKVQSTLKEMNISAVIHFAAFAYVGESVEKPEIYYRNNVQGTMSLLEAMLQADVKKLVFSSTCATYGIPETIPISEECEQNPINPYGQTKLIIERILKDYGHAYGLKSFCLRYFNASGADRDCETGEMHEPETHLIPLAVQSALTGSVLKIFGDDYPTPDGTCLRDYIHVADLGDAHVKALQFLQNTNSNFEVVNLGNEKSYSVKEVIEETEKITGKKVNAEIFPRRAGDPAALVANSSKAKRILNWKPEFSDIHTIIESAVKWHKHQLHL